MTLSVMATDAAFGSHKIVAFAATSRPAKARRFYRDTLGLRLVSEDEFALAFDAHGTMLRVSIVNEVVAAEYTVLGWQVADIVAAAKRLQMAGVRLQRYSGMGQDTAAHLDVAERRQSRVVQRPRRQHAEHHAVLRRP